ncbi:MAG: hypothetical protein GTO46_15110 [Gemmatimonadetes bacterium]|nr:hypothetical protein [Gemmatimonadota bacterium]NIO32968.1 hypothetical protein [Gemmatimonadota bacterium]
MTRQDMTLGLARIPLALAALLVACSGASGPAVHEWQAAYDTIGDTIVVRTESGSVWGDTAGLVTDLTIGRFEGPDEYMFGQVRSLAVAADGSIYAFDSHAMELRKYGPDGTYLGTFGREGGGPGEYKRPDGGLAVLSDGRVVLRDPGNTRLTVYSGDGEYLEGWRIRGSFNTSRRLYRDTADAVYTLILLDPHAAVVDWTVGLVRYSSDGLIGDTLAAPIYDFEPPRLVAQRRTDDGVSTSVNSVPFSPDDFWTFSPLGYMVGGLSTRYAIDLFVAPGRVLRIEKVDWEPAPVLTAEKEERERISTANARSTQPNWRWNGPPIPDTKPPYAGAYIGEHGRIWVRLHQEAYQIEKAEPERELAPGETPERTWFEPVVFDVFEPNGRYLGMVRAPDGFSNYPTPVIRGDTVWAVVRDDLDVPYIKRFHIEHGRETN